jgi:hypothetical protein
MRPFILFIGLVLLAGCSHRAPPTCDGSDKRPLNAGKWTGVMNLGACFAKESHP